MIEDPQRKPEVEIITRDDDPGTALVSRVTIEDQLGWVVAEAERIDVRDSATWEGVRLDWLQEKRDRTGREHTVEVYASAFNQFFEWTRVVFGQYIPPWGVTLPVAQAWAKWLRSGAKVLRTKNVDDSGATWDGVDEGLPDWMLWDAPDGRLVAREVQADGSVVICERGPLSDSSVNLKLAALSSFYLYVKGHSQIFVPGHQEPMRIWPDDRANPFDPASITRVKVKAYSNIPPFPSPSELEAILQAINTDCLRGKRDYAILFGLMYTCRRFSEFIELRWGDIEAGPDGDYVYTVNIRKKGKNSRTRLALDAVVYDAIVDYLREAGRLETMANDDYIWTRLQTERVTRLPGHEGEPGLPYLSNGTVNGILKKCARWAGVDEVKAHVHGLRHGGMRWRALLMEQTNGVVDYEELKRISQHESLDMVYRYAQKVLATPEDKYGKQVAAGLAATGKVRRKKKVAPEQGRLF